MIAARLARLAQQAACGDGRLAKTDFRVKLALAVAFSVIALLAPGFIAALLLAAMTLSALALGEAARVAKAVLLSAPLLAFYYATAMLVQALTGGIDPVGSAVVALRLLVLVATSSLLLLGSRPSAILRGLSSMRLPRSAVASLALSLRMLGQASRDYYLLLEALSASYGRSKRLRAKLFYAKKLLLSSSYLLVYSALESAEAIYSRGLLHEHKPSK